MSYSQYFPYTYSGHEGGGGEGANSLVHEVECGRYYFFSSTTPVPDPYPWNHLKCSLGVSSHKEHGYNVPNPKTWKTKKGKAVLEGLKLEAINNEWESLRQLGGYKKQSR